MYGNIKFSYVLFGVIFTVNCTC